MHYLLRFITYAQPLSPSYDSYAYASAHLMFCLFRFMTEVMYISVIVDGNMLLLVGYAPVAISNAPRR